MLNEFRSTSITWDKATSRIYSPVTANESDENGRKLVVQIVNGGQVEDLTGATLHLYWETRDKAHDGLDVFKAVDLKKGEFELSYTTGMLSNQGVLNANLVLIDTVGRVVSERFKITVTEGIDNDAIQSENSFSSLTQALIDVSNLEQNYTPRLNDLTAQLQQTEQELNTQLAQNMTVANNFLKDISQAEKFVVEKNAYNHVPNVDNYLSIPTYDGSGLSTHPKVLYFENGWNGYKFWMAHTPYPYENDDYENPCIAVSNDGTIWTDFPGLVNPLDSPDPALGYDSDTHLVMVNNRLEIYWRYDNHTDGVITFYKRTSTDGLNWTSKQVVFTRNSNLSVSPSIIFDDNKYKMWVLDGTLPYLDYDYYESVDGFSWTKLHTIKFTYENVAGWHGDVIKTGDKYEILTMGINQVTGRSDLYYMFSYDNINYSNPLKILSSRNGSVYFDNAGVYRSTFVVVGKKYYLYYTPINTSKEYRIALTIGDNPLNFGVNAQKVELSTYRTTAQDTYEPSDSIKMFPQNAITVTKITSSFASANGFPESFPGTLITDNTFPEGGRQKQSYQLYNSNKVYVRYTDASGNWTPFTKDITIFVSPDNAYTPSQPITDYPKAYVTKTKITNSFAVANGFPGGVGGMLETDNSIAEKGFQNQKYYLYSNYRVYQRTSKVDGTWTTWKLDNTTIGNTASRPTDVNTGFMYYDNSLAKPIWFDGTNWRDATGTVV